MWCCREARQGGRSSKHAIASQGPTRTSTQSISRRWRSSHLLGDPSIHPVKVGAHALASTKTYQANLGQAEAAWSPVPARAPGSHRQQPAQHARQRVHAVPPPAHVTKLLDAAAQEVGLQSPTHKSFTVSFAPSASRGELRQFSERRMRRSVHMTTSLGEPAGKGSAAASDPDCHR